jgi:hypothetical protein
MPILLFWGGFLLLFWGGFLLLFLEEPSPPFFEVDLSSSDLGD